MATFSPFTLCIEASSFITLSFICSDDSKMEKMRVRHPRCIILLARGLHHVVRTQQSPPPLLASLVNK